MEKERIFYESCPLCGQQEISALFKVKDYSVSNEIFDLSKCDNCDFTFTQNIPIDEEIGKYYQSEDYISHSDTQKGLVSKLYHLVRRRMLVRKRKLIGALGEGKKLLDIGAGTGYFPNEMRQSGFDVTGVEVDQGARENARKNFGFNFFSSIDEIENNEKFDFITLWHVLEHLYEPKKRMTEFYDLLEDSGHLIIAVPNRDSADADHYKEYWAAYDVPIHLWHFTPTTMLRLAKECRFEIIAKYQLPFDPFYVSILSEKYKGSGKLGLLKGFWVGLKSFLCGKKDVNKGSSVVYVMRK